MNINTLILARAAIVFAALALVSLIALHIVSPEFDPSWRMVSEYARGNYSWILSIMFCSWALSTWMLALAILPLASKTGSIGLVLLAVAGLGEAMASVFNIDHPLHDVAGLLGVLCLPVSALLLSRKLRIWRDGKGGTGLLMWMANLPWISLVLFVASMIVMYIQFTKAGGQVSAHVTQLPKGVTGLSGWANRLMILVYFSWAIIAARFVSHLKTKVFGYESASV